MNIRKLLFLLFATACSTFVFGQDNSLFQHTNFTSYDSLRGALNPHRSCYDVTFYDLRLKVNIEDRSISGHNTIHYRTVAPFTRLQVDLFANMEIDSIVFEQQKLVYARDSHYVFVQFPEKQAEGQQQALTIYYHGHPVVAKNPPWDGGFVWEKDEKGRPWVGVACEMIGASLWWPCKDHLSDEPDSAALSIIVPDSLVAVANGRLQSKTLFKEGWEKYDWRVDHPINNYNITLNIADYAHFNDHYVNHGDTLDLSYYVLSYNADTAKTHFKQVPDVLRAFEHYFGKYPFWDDSYKLVETPYLGMEHQSAIAYGNPYDNNLEPRDLMGFKGDLGLHYDYIIVHETGHEWWGNSLSANDFAELWLHESFTTYAEALFVEYHFGYDTALQYLNQQRTLIGNVEPLVGPKNVNFHYWSYINDLYYKGSWLLHTLRHVIDEDSLWFSILREFAVQNKYTNVTTDQFIEFVQERTERDLGYFFQQYLFYPDPPVLNYRLEKKGRDTKVSYRWHAAVEHFQMPVTIRTEQGTIRLHPTIDWQEKVLPGTKPKQVEIATDLYYIKLNRKNK